MDKEQGVLYGDFLRIIEELTDTAHSIARIEEEKAVALAQRQHERLEGFIKKEQACILKLRGLDQHRIRSARRLGWDPQDLSQILGQVDPEQKEQLKRLFDGLEQELKRLWRSKEVAKRMLDVRVYELFITVEREAGIPYDRARRVDLDGFPYTKLCDRYG